MDQLAAMQSGGKIDLEALENLVSLMKSQQLNAISVDQLAGLVDKKATLNDLEESIGLGVKSGFVNNTNVPAPFGISSSAQFDNTLFGDPNCIKFTIGKSSTSP